MSLLNSTLKFDTESEFSREMLISNDGYRMPYRLYIPHNYDCGSVYPVLIFLHGAGERGNDNELQIQVALPHIFDSEESPARSAIIIAPQCPEDRQWVYTPWEKGNYSVSEVPESRECEAMLEILKSVDREYNIDRSRIYITGLSMGGFGSWDMLSRHPSLFAASLIVCGGGDPSQAKTLSQFPLRIFHGDRDTAVPTECSREMFNAIKKCGRGKIKYTEIENMGHDIWDEVYSDPANIKWLFSKISKPIARNEKNKFRRAGIAGVLLGVAGAVILSLRKRGK